MTKEEIKNYNRLCAEFLGGVYDSDMTRYWFHLPVKWDGVFAPTTEELKFHSDWSWIMGVVEAIENLGYATVISHDYCVSNYGSDLCEIDYKSNALEREEYKDEPIVEELTKTKKEAVVQAINQFLIWYNENEIQPNKQ